MQPSKIANLAFLALQSKVLQNKDHLIRIQGSSDLRDRSGFFADSMVLVGRDRSFIRWDARSSNYN